MSTLLSDLESAPGPGKDGDLVDQIIKEMNGVGSQQGSDMFVPPQPPPSPAMMPSNQGMMPVQMSNTALSSYHMDNAPATAHMIGGASPSPADFAAAMHGGASMSHESESTPALPPRRPYKRSILQRLGEEFKIPMLVALLVFVFSLPVVNFLFAHYLPYFVLPTGQLKTIGLIIKSLAAGVVFWVLQRIIVPLFSL